MCSIEGEKSLGTRECDCENCKELIENITECDICTEPLWSNGSVSSCFRCGSLICFTCSQKLVTACPFCRVSVVCPWQRNLAVEKLIRKLRLPCRHSKRGCERWIRHTSEQNHEQNCEFSSPTTTVCPFAPTCNWRGTDFETITGHLKQIHSLVLLNGDRITVEIASLQKKVQQTEEHPSKYVVMLRCHSSFFCCKIALFKRELNIVFTEVCSQRKNRKYVAWLELSNSTKPFVKGILEIPDDIKRSKELHVNCDHLLPSSQTTRTAAAAVENSLKILINIQPLNN